MVRGEKKLKSILRKERKNLEKKTIRKRIDTDDENQEDKKDEEQPTVIDIIRRNEDRGFSRGNRPRVGKTRYQERRGREEVTKEELTSNATSTFPKP